MRPEQRDLARRKLDRIVKCLRRLQQARDTTLDEYQSDGDLQAILERQLELAVGAATDLNVYLLVQSGYGTPADARSSYLEAAHHLKLFPMSLARRLAPLAGLRNQLIHFYAELDHGLVLNGLRDALDLLPQYVAAVEEHLAGLPGDESSARCSQ